MAAYQSVSRRRTRDVDASVDETIIVSCTKTISRSSNGLKKLRLEVVVNLSSQSSDENLEDVGERIVILVPHMRSNRRAIDYLSRMQHKKFQQPEFLGRELDWPPGPRHTLGFERNLEICNLDHPWDEGLASSAQGAEPGNELLKGK